MKEKVQKQKENKQKENKQKQNKFINLQKFFALAWSISPVYLFVIVINGILNCIQILLQVILPKFLIDELLGDKRVEYLIGISAAIVMVNCVCSLLAKSIQCYMDSKNSYVTDKMSEAMAEKIMEVDFSYLENPYYLDLKERAVFAIRNQSVLFQVVQQMTEIVKAIFTIVGLVVLFLSLSPIILCILLATIVAIIIIYSFFMKYELLFYQSLIPINRKYGYYIGLAFESTYQKDIRLYHMSDMLTNQIGTYTEQINKQFMEYHKKAGKYQGIISMIQDLQAALAYGYVGIRVVTDRFGARIGIGSFTMYVTSIIQATASMHDLFQQFITFQQMLGYLDPFMEFMSLPSLKEQGKGIELDKDIQEIAFEHITFSYPNSDKVILNDVSFSIKKGEKISIVGLNGAGKTTLVKLLCRLYHPDSGTIRINGVDIFEYEYESYMKQIAAIFQDYKLFAFTIRENITCNKSKKDMRMEQIISDVDMEEKIKELPNGIETLFGKEYDKAGIEMSGGQSQKIAIARALYKDASLIILDEPTSALDPIAEADIYQNFNQMVEGKTALYISHRMSSSVFCDKILILNNGILEDFDTHGNLMKKTEGLYYQLFSSQAENYRMTTENTNFA